MGQRNGFSAGDVAKLNGMYNCKKDSSTSSASNGRPPLLSSGPTTTSNSGNSYPVLNFISNLVKPFFQEENESNEINESNESNETNSTEVA